MGNGPWSGGPNYGGHIAADFRGFARTATHYTKFHPDRWAGVVFVFHLGFGQSGGIMDAPIYRLTPAIDVAALHEVQKRAGDRRFVIEAHREVRIAPASKDPEAFEVAFVLLDKARRKLAAKFAELRGRHFAFAAQLLFHL